MNNEIRLSVSRARQFDIDADRDVKIILHWERIVMAKPYTPPPAVAAWLRKYEIEKPKGRDYAALTEAALRKPRSDDDALREKFGGGSKPKALAADTRVPAAAPASSDVWPKYLLGMCSGRVFSYNVDSEGRWFTPCGATGACRYPYSVNAPDGDFEQITQTQFIAKLREWAHPALAEFDTPPQPTDDLYEPVGTMPVVGDRVCMTYAPDKIGTVIEVKKWGSEKHAATVFGDGGFTSCDIGCFYGDIASRGVIARILARQPSTKAPQCMAAMGGK